MNERIFEILHGARTPPIGYYDPEHFNAMPKLKGFFCGHNAGKNKPRVSYGVAIRDLRMDKWCCMAPAATIEFRILLEGNYLPAELPIIISQLYDHELRITREHLSTETFRVVCRRHLLRELDDIFYGIYMFHMDSIRMIANNVFEERKMHTLYGDICQLGFPKGRGAHDETPLQSALRELGEETGIRICTVGKGGREWFWERVEMNLCGETHIGFLFQEPVVHTHVDITGKAFKTLIWIVHTNLPRTLTDVDIPVIHSLTPHEVGAIGWHPSMYCSRFSRVKELFHKVWLMSEDMKNITTTVDEDSSVMVIDE